MSAFNGDGVYDAAKWISDFERVCAPFDVDDKFRLKCIRRLMQINHDKSITYLEFKENFLKNFGHVFSVVEVIYMLKNTKFNPSNTTEMEEIAARVELDEIQIIQFIIDGLNDRSSNIAILYPATTMKHLETLAQRYVVYGTVFSFY